MLGGLNSPEVLARSTFSMPRQRSVCGPSCRSALRARARRHRVVAWGKVGELCAQYLSKGRTVYVEGRIQTREWEDKDGNKRSTTEINAQTVQFLGGMRGEADAGPRPSAPGGDDPSGGASGGAPPGDDIPF